MAGNHCESCKEIKQYKLSQACSLGLSSPKMWLRVFGKMAQYLSKQPSCYLGSILKYTSQGCLETSGYIYLVF
jgi:hypothetical protein